MKSAIIKKIILFSALAITPVFAYQLESDNPMYRQEPDPVILTGVGQIVNSAMSIAQDPHNHSNIGYCVGNMVHGIINIIVAKLAKRKTKFTRQELDEYIAELLANTGEEIIETINAHYCLAKKN